MLFDRSELENLKSQLAQTYSPEQYCSKAADSIVAMLDRNSQSWKHFGPYWPVVQTLLARYRPDVPTHNWGTPPDYLSHYTYNDPMTDAIAALHYLNRDEYLAPLGTPHSIEMPDGSNALYEPELGIIES